MIGVSNPLPPLCDCGNIISREVSECRACREDRDAIEATGRADEFQARSSEWFTSLSPVALELKVERYFYNATNYPEDCR